MTASREMCRRLLAAALLAVAGVSAVAPSPVTQPAYTGGQYVGAQNLQGGQYRQTYVPAHLLAASRAQQTAAEGLRQYSTQGQQEQREPIQQVLLSSNVDRQVQRVAQLAGPAFLQHVQTAQQQGQAQEAIAAAQRKQTSQTLGRQIQPIPVAVQPAPQQYSRDITLRYNKPLIQTAAYKQIQAENPRYQQQEEQQAAEPEDYDPNPSYQFGFDVKDDLYTNYQNRKEQREGNKITGSYSVVDSDGFIRTVTYTADPKEGFKAEVTRQPTDIVVKIPKQDPQFVKQPIQYVQEAPAPRAQGEKQNLVYRYQ